MAPVDTARLPRGRHGLSREEVGRAQRARLLLAMADAVSRKGFVATTVADVIAGAGVSRETYYQQFSSKSACFMATFDAAAEVLFARVAEGLDPDLAPVDRFAVVFDRYLDTLVEHRAYARVFLVEVYAAGPEAIDRRAAMQQRIVDVVADLLGTTGTRGRFACTVLVAAVGALVTKPLVDDDLDALRALRDPVVDLVAHVLATADD